MVWKSIHFAAFVGAPAFIALLANTHTSDLKVKTLGGETFFTAAAAKLRKNCAELPVENQKLRTVRGRNPHTPTSPGGKNEKNVLLHRVRDSENKSFPNLLLFILFFFTRPSVKEPAENILNQDTVRSVPAALPIGASDSGGRSLTKVTSTANHLGAEKSPKSVFRPPLFSWREADWSSGLLQFFWKYQDSDLWIWMIFRSSQRRHLSSSGFSRVLVPDSLPG